MPFLGHTIFFNKLRHKSHKINKCAERCSQKPGLYCCEVPEFTNQTTFRPFFLGSTEGERIPHLINFIVAPNGPHDNQNFIPFAKHKAKCGITQHVLAQGLNRGITTDKRTTTHASRHHRKRQACSNLMCGGGHLSAHRARRFRCTSVVTLPAK